MRYWRLDNSEQRGLLFVDNKIFKMNLMCVKFSLEADNLFEDVVDEYASLSIIKSHLEKWKFQHSQSYQQAYVSLCLPKLFSPFVKLQLVTWNPLEVKAKELEEMGWFKMLMIYGFREGQKG
ncbi:PAX3- and PAX7-binding protein 1-like isoform X2 [Dysidea avara]|uniref:PAX3- and PAX7-binding protein 1-like isoform X2 n=1 Tax=Dysidea avara TaxID=196820 RepID=UPI003327EAA0